MKKKIILGVVCIIIAVIVTITLINAGKNNNTLPDNKTNGYESLYQNGNIAAEGMEPINKNIVLGDVLSQVKKNEVKKLTGITDEEANKLVDLREYVGLEKKVAKYESDNDFTEVWVIKLSDPAQAEKIFRLFNERIEDLRAEYKDNEKISKILNDEKNIRMKKQSEIAIIIISNNAEEVENALDMEFKSK